MLISRFSENLGRVQFLSNLVQERTGSFHSNFFLTEKQRLGCNLWISSYHYDLLKQSRLHFVLEVVQRLGKAP